MNEPNPCFYCGTIPKVRKSLGTSSSAINVFCDGCSRCTGWRDNEEEAVVEWNHWNPLKIEASKNSILRVATTLLGRVMQACEENGQYAYAIQIGKAFGAMLKAVDEWIAGKNR